jgi:hypothetical protein
MRNARQNLVMESLSDVPRHAHRTCRIVRQEHHSDLSAFKKHLGSATCGSHRKRISWATKSSNKLPIDQSPGLTNPGRSISCRDVCACLIGRPTVAREYRCSFVRRDLAFQHRLRCRLRRDRAYIPQQLQADYLLERSRSRRVGQGRAMRPSLPRRCNMALDWPTAIPAS